jgi:hypothetical protein
MAYEKRNVILVKAGWKSYALPLNDMNLSFVRSMIEDAVSVDYAYIKGSDYVYYPQPGNELSFEIRSVLWSDQKPERPPEDESPPLVD